MNLKSNKKPAGTGNFHQALDCNNFLFLAPPKTLIIFEQVAQFPESLICLFHIQQFFFFCSSLEGRTISRVLEIFF